MALRKVKPESSEPEQRAVTGWVAQQSVGSLSSQPMGVTPQGRNVASVHESGPDEESEPEPPVTRARSRAHAVTSEAHQSTSDSDVCDVKLKQTMRGRAWHPTQQKSVDNCTAESQPRSPRAPSDTDERSRRKMYAKPLPAGKRLEPVSDGCSHMHWKLAPYHTDEQLQNAKEALDALMVAFHAQPAASVHEDSSTLAASVERRSDAPAPARGPSSLSGQAVLPDDHTPGKGVVGPQRQRNRCTRVVNIVNVHDSKPVPKRVRKDRAAGDSVTTSVAAQSRGTSQPLEMSDDSDPRCHKTRPAVEKHSGRKYRESGLRLPLFDGYDWPGFILQFETCARHYRWSDRIKAIRLYTSIVGDATQTLGYAMGAHWSYHTLKKHLDVRYGRNKRSSQVQDVLLAIQRRPGQTLRSYFDIIRKTANVADITDEERDALVYTAFISGLRTNTHMHHWVASREHCGTIASACRLAHRYEAEFGTFPTSQSPVVTAETRSAMQSSTQKASVSPDVKQTVESVSQGPKPLIIQTGPGYHDLRKQMSAKFSSVNSRLNIVESYQREKSNRWKQQQAAWVPAGQQHPNATRRGKQQANKLSKPDRYSSYDKRAADRRNFPKRRDDGWRPNRNFHRSTGHE